MRLDGDHLTLLYLLLEWVIRIVMIIVIPLRRPPEAARSWLLLVLFLPVPALILYRLIGRPRFPAWRTKRFQETAPLRQTIVDALSVHHSRDNDIAVLAEHLGGWPSTAGNRIVFHTDYETIVASMVEAIERARTSVHLLTYIFADDATGRRLSHALADAVARGVHVRVLVDALGSRPWARRSIAMLRNAGVEARLVLPVQPLALRRARSDLRNHRKLCLIDGRLGFVGSLNIVDRDFKAGIVNDELVAQIEGPAVAPLDGVFATDWYLETGKRLSLSAVSGSCGDSTVQTIPSGPDYGEGGYERLLVELVHRARHCVTLVTPYLVPDDALLVAMKNAVARGATVKLILSQVIDQRLVRLAQRSFYTELLQAGVQIHLYRDHLLHAKSVSVDRLFGLVGSSNADIRSFMLNAEISVMLEDRATVERLDRIHDAYEARSDRLMLAQWRTRSRPVRLAENLARLVTPLL